LNTNSDENINNSFLMNYLDNLGDFDNIDDLRKELEKRIKAHNEGAIDDFEGLSPNQMQALHYDFPNSDAPLKLNNLSEKQLEQCPILVQARLLIDKMKDGKTIQLTKTGALRPKLVKEVYGLGLIKHELIESGMMKLTKEMDVPSVEITKILLQISSLSKKRKGKLSLTKKGEEFADDGNAILKEMFLMLIDKFNWAYFDGFDSENIGKVNPGYSLYLLKKYGDKKRSVNFYADRYFKAFPHLITDGRSPYNAYKVRTFERYFNYFGFVKLERERYPNPNFIQKTKFLDSLISYNLDDNT